MRQDMFKVIVERPRRGVGYYRNLPNQYRAAKHFQLDEDYDVTDEFSGRRIHSMRPKNDYKSLNENLRPLRRFLYSKVGQPWNDVFSEICAELDTNSTVKKHVRDHLEDFVEMNTYIREDGEACYRSRYVFFRGHDHDNIELIRYVSGLYVCPRTGILRNAEKDFPGANWYKEQPDYIKQQEEKLKQELNRRVINDNLRFERIDNVWFRFERSTCPLRLWNSETNSYYDHPTSLGVQENRKTASKKDIRKYDLNNPESAEKYNSLKHIRIITSWLHFERVKGVWFRRITDNTAGITTVQYTPATRREIRTYIQGKGK